MTNSICYLLNRCNETNLSESELASAEVAKADKSLFIQELILTTLADSASPVNLNEEPVPAILNVDLLKREQQELLIQNQEKGKSEDHVKPVEIEESEEHVDEDAKGIDDVENREPEIPDECEGLDTSEDVIISPEDKDEDRDDGHVAAAIRTKVPQSPPPTALRSTDNLPAGSDHVATINFDSLLLNDNNTPVLNVNQVPMLQQRSSPASTTSTLSNASVKNRNTVPSAATPAAPATSVVHPLMMNTCQSSSAATAASSQPHVQINPASIRTSSQSQSTWTGPTAVRRRTVNNELHSLSRNSSNRTDRTSAASASGPTHPLKRGLSQPQTSPAPPQET